MTVQRIKMMIGGAQKSGTTSLFRYLEQHPEIKTHRQPEMSFFVNDVEFDRGYEHGWKKYFGALHFDNVQLVSKHVLLMCSRPAIHRLVEHNPNVHLVLSLRNPVDRAYSSYWYARRRAWEDFDSFEEAIAHEDERLRNGWYRWRRNAYLFAGRYIEFINNIITLLGPRQLHIVTMEELVQRPKEICSTLFEAIGVDTSFEPSMCVNHNPSATVRSSWVASTVHRLAASRHPTRNMLRRLVPAAWSNRIRQKINRWNEVQFSPPPMNTELRRRLVEYYRPYNEQLGTLLHRDFRDWNV